MTIDAPYGFLELDKVNEIISLLPQANGDQDGFYDNNYLTFSLNNVQLSVKILILYSTDCTVRKVSFAPAFVSIEYQVYSGEKTQSIGLDLEPNCPDNIEVASRLKVLSIQSFGL